MCVTAMPTMLAPTNSEVGDQKSASTADRQQWEDTTERQKFSYLLIRMQ